MVELAKAAVTQPAKQSKNKKNTGKLYIAECLKLIIGQAPFQCCKQIIGDALPQLFGLDN